MAGIFPPPTTSSSSGGPSGSSSSSSTSATSQSTSSTSNTSTSTTTSNTTSNTSTSSSSSSSVSSSSSSSSASSSTPTSSSTTSSTTQLAPTPTPTRATTTSTSTQFVSDTLGAAPVQTSLPSGGHPKSFFANKGAVAGVFSVVGLIALALLIALVTNGIRRRRAKKFDRELQEATLEAASAPKPIFLDDDDDLAGGPAGYGGRGGGGGGYGAGEYSDYGNSGGQFSDVSSHGTFGQPPMSVSSGHGGHMESYNMRELGPGPGGMMGSGPSPGEVFDPYAVGGAAGAAGIGVARARSMKSTQDAGQPAYGQALQEGGMPYAAFAGPGYGGYDPYANPQNQSSVNPAQRNAEILEAAGMGAHLSGAGAALNRGPSMGGQYGYQQQYQQPQQYPQQQPPQPMSAASGNSGASQYFSPVAESYASHYQQPQGQPPPQGQPGHQKGLSVISGGGTEADGDLDDAYGGYEAADAGVGAGGDAGKLPNPFANATSDGGHHGAGGSGGHGSRESRYSDEDDEIEEEPPRRVLKVANE